MDETDGPLERGALYRHDDGRVEIVFELESGRVLTVSEYPSEDTFHEAMGDAEYEGEHEGVLDLPPVEAFDVEE